jgi:alpha-glucoside transport system permease protein
VSQSLDPLSLAETQVALKPGAKRPRRGVAADSTNWLGALVFFGPAALLLLVFVVYPTIYTIALSFNRGRRGEFTEWLGLENFVTLFTKDPNFINFGTFPPTGAVWNNVLWIIFYTGFVLAFGLIVATLAARVRYEAVIKAIVFLPMAIAATALAVIWKFVYAPDANIGLLNAVLGIGNIDPISWLGNVSFVNAALIAAGTWASVGFATVILSAALKGIPAEVLEAARTDGANERQIFFRIILPMVSLPMSVLAVTLIVNVVKLFDLIYVMTNGGPGTASRVIGYTFYVEGFQAGLFGKSAAIAVVMLIVLIPIMIFNIRRFRTAAVV